MILVGLTAITYLVRWWSSTRGSPSAAKESLTKVPPASFGNDKTVLR